MCRIAYIHLQKSGEEMQSRRDDDRRWPEQWEEAPLRRASYGEPGIQRRTTSQARTQRSAADRYDASDGYRRPASRYDDEYRRATSRYDDEYRRPASRYDEDYRRATSRYGDEYRRPVSRYDDEYLRPANRYDDEYRRPAGGNGRAAARRRPKRCPTPGKARGALPTCIPFRRQPPPSV